MILTKELIQKSNLTVKQKIKLQFNNHQKKGKNFNLKITFFLQIL